MFSAGHLPSKTLASIRSPSPRQSTPKIVSFSRRRRLRSCYFTALLEERRGGYCTGRRDQLRRSLAWRWDHSANLFLERLVRQDSTRSRTVGVGHEQRNRTVLLKRL